MSSDEIRGAFLRFFEEKQHKVIPSSSLVPHGDPTLLLTTAGMVQIKPYFLGLAVPPNLRLASCQKCFRTTDIDSVGDAKHLTFFEMLGNFSVGDYFKKEAIAWAWEFVTQYLKLSPERLWVTIYSDDDEAFDYWRGIGFPEEKIVRLGEEDNFWGPAGDSGPCGPCSEIHYDFGEGVGCGRPECKPGCDCSRFSEIWNLVFTQYNQDRDGKRTALPKPNIDTGMGLERTAAVMQGVSSVYETDLFLPILNRIYHLAGKEYGKDKVADQAVRIVAEHSRGIAFLIAAGVSSSNQGRGYVLRRILRRACFFGRKLGIEKPFLSEIAEVAIAKMGHIYPDLVTNRDLISQVIEAEETKFRETILVGLGVLEGTFIKLREELEQYFPQFEKSFKAALSQRDIIDLSNDINAAMEHFQRDCHAWWHTFMIGGRDAVKECLSPVNMDLEKLKNMVSKYSLPLAPFKKKLRAYFEKIEADVDSVAKELTGFEVFILWDTYGFPKELTGEITRNEGVSIDLEGFESEMKKQRERARAGKKFNITLTEKIVFEDKVKIELIPKHTSFIGHDRLKSSSKVRHILEQDSGFTVPSASKGQKVAIDLEETPFYGEMGGQVGDTGKITADSGQINVTNTVWSPYGSLGEGAIIHLGQVVKGNISVDDIVEAEVDADRRLDIARNHSATHLLQAALRQVLGSQVYQRGSLVAPDRFRFDFSHLTVISKQELGEIQHIVNEKIRQNLPVKSKVVPYKQAIEEGAIALFEEKYGETVRVIEIGKPPTSTELCGGIHVKSTGEIGLLLIISESSIGTGLRRIEAVTGREAEALLQERFGALDTIAEKLKSTPSEAQKAVIALTAALTAEHKRSASLERELSRNIVEALLEKTEQVNGITVLTASVPSCSMPVLREMGDLLRDRLKSAVIVLGTVYQDKPAFMANVTPDLLDRGLHAGDIVKQVAAVTGGSGGGKAAMAQAGGRDKSKLEEALALVKGLVQEIG